MSLSSASAYLAALASPETSSILRQFNLAEIFSIFYTEFPLYAAILNKLENT